MPRQFKVARKMNKLKLFEAAEKLGVSQPTLSSWESGRKSPTLDKLESMSHLYGVTTDFLLGLTSNKVLPDTELVPADNYIVMHGKPVWSKKYGWMIVDAVNKVMIQDQDTIVPFEEMQEIYYRVPLFSEGPVPTDAPLRKDELYASKEVWVEPISADDKLRSELRAICDDNNDYINTLENYIDELKVKNLEHDVFYSGEELLNEYKNNEANYDAIFMDMEMGELDGIETANLIRPFDRNVIIVFVTSHKKYMQRSFQCMPFRFLIKPIHFLDFKKVYNEICIKLEDDPETFIFLENKKITRIYCSDIIFFESNSHWILIHTRDGKTHKTRKTMSELLETIEKSTFIRVHRAFAVNLKHVYQIEENDVIMHHYSEPIPISKTYKKELSDEFSNFKERKYLL